MSKRHGCPIVTVVDDDVERVTYDVYRQRLRYVGTAPWRAIASQGACSTEYPQVLKH